MDLDSLINSRPAVTPDVAPPDETAPAPSAPSPAATGAPNLKGAVAAAAEMYGVDPNVIAGIAMKESALRPDIISGERKSSAGAIGLMQFMPDTAKRYRIDPTDPVQSIFGAAAYLRDNLDRFNGNYAKAIAGYNWGENRDALNAPDWQSKLPPETKDYVDFVQQFARAMGTKDAPASEPMPGRGNINPPSVVPSAPPPVAAAPAPSPAVGQPDLGADTGIDGIQSTPLPAVSAAGAGRGFVNPNGPPPDAGAGRGFINNDKTTAQIDASKRGLLADIPVGIKHTGMQFAGAYANLLNEWLQGDSEHPDTAPTGEDLGGQALLRTAAKPENAPSRWTGEMAGGATHMLAGGVAPVTMAMTQAASLNQELLDRGVDPQTARKVSDASGLIQGASAAIPFGSVAWGTLKSAVVTGLKSSGIAAVSGAAQEQIADGLTKWLLSSKGYDELANEYGPTLEKAGNSALSMLGFHFAVQAAHAAPMVAAAANDRLGSQSRQFGRALGQDVDAAQFSPEGVDQSARATLDPQNYDAQTVSPLDTAKPIIPPVAPAADPIHTILDAGSVDEATHAAAAAIQTPSGKPSVADQLLAIRPIQDVGTSVNGSMQEALRNAGLADKALNDSTSGASEPVVAGSGEPANSVADAGVAGARSEPVADAARVDAAAAEPVQPGGETLPLGTGRVGDEAAVAPAPLYASRPVLNAGDIVAWAKSQGFKATLSPGPIHLGPEKQEPLNLDKANEYVEKPVAPTLADRVEAMRAPPTPSLADRVEAMRAQPEVATPEAPAPEATKTPEVSVKPVEPQAANDQTAATAEKPPRAPEVQQMIELRKRESVLQSLLECLGA